jgi:hypothetical protein
MGEILNISIEDFIREIPANELFEKDLFLTILLETRPVQVL